MQKIAIFHPFKFINTTKDFKKQLIRILHVAEHKRIIRHIRLEQNMMRLYYTKALENYMAELLRMT